MRRYARVALTATELERGDRSALLLSGELDLASAPILDAALVRVSAQRARGLTLDLSQLTFIDASGLHVIVYANQLYKRLGYGFSLIPGPEAVQRLFQLTGLIDELPFLLSCPTIDVKAKGAVGPHERGVFAGPGNSLCGGE
jgi:anti-anti-sigma factor